MFLSETDGFRSRNLFMVGTCGSWVKIIRLVHCSTRRDQVSSREIVHRLTFRSCPSILKIQEMQDQLSSEAVSSMVTQRGLSSEHLILLQIVRMIAI